MDTRGIVKYPHEVLHTPCLPITRFDDNIEKFGTSLMAAASFPNRIGVAAPQIGAALNMFAAKVPGPAVTLFINPKIKAYEGIEVDEEGCLSLADRNFEVQRAEWIYIEAQDVHGDPFEVDVHGFLARTLQHEIDHLSGVLVIDRVREQLQLMHRPQRRRMQVELAKLK